VAVKALATGGYFDDCGECVVWEADLAEGTNRIVFRWTPPEQLRVPGKGFAGACFGPDGMLYAAAHAAVVRIDPVQWKVSGILHQPCMNDLHHVAAEGDRLYVANTGLESVDVFKLSGEFIASHALLPAWANARRIAGQDPPSWPDCLDAGWEPRPREAWLTTPSRDGYHTPDRGTGAFHQQKVTDRLHINHILIDEHRPIATCFGDGSLRDLADHRILFQKEGAYIHDALPIGGSIWLSATDGRLFELGRSDFRLKRTLDAFGTGHFGWCRGLASSGEHLLVGLTEVRSGRLQPDRWANRNPEGSETSILLVHRSNGRLVSRADLSNPGRHSKIYSILPKRSKTI
jgi:hypothetical protein